MWIDIVKEIYRRYPEEVENIARHNAWIHKDVEYEEQIKYEKLGDTVYVLKNIGNRTKFSALRNIFENLEIPQSALEFYLEPLSPVVSEVNETSENQLN